MAQTRNNVTTKKSTATKTPKKAGGNKAMKKAASSSSSTGSARKPVKIKTKVIKKVVTKVVKEKVKKKKDPKRQESMKRNYHIIAWRAAAKEMGYLQKDSKDGFKKIPPRSSSEYEAIMALKQKKYFEIIANDPSARANEESRLRKAHVQLQEMAERMQAIEANA